MKIGINARFLPRPYTGIGKYTANLMRAISKMDESNEYFLLTPELVDFPLPENFRQVRVPEKDYSSPSLRKAHWEYVLVPEEMKKWGVGLAHFLYPSNPLKAMGIPTIVTLHDMIPWRLPEYNKRMRSRLYHFYVKQALKRADHIITVSEFSKQEMQQLTKIKNSNVSVTHLAAPEADDDNMPEELNLRRKFLLYVGGYDSRKNVPMLMIAFQKFIANNYPIDLILVGGKGRGLDEFLTDEFAQKVADRFPVRPKGNIIFTEPLLDSELATLYRSALALVHPSRYEGFNLPLTEAMAQGLPIVAADIPVNREVAGPAAYYADPESEDSFGLGLHAFLNDKHLQEEITLQSKLRSEKFDWNNTARQTLDVYNLFM